MAGGLGYYMYVKKNLVGGGRGMRFERGFFDWGVGGLYFSLLRSGGCCGSGLMLRWLCRSFVGSRLFSKRIERVRRGLFSIRGCRNHSSD